MRELHHLSDEALLRAAAAGDADAFGAFFDRHARAVLQFVRSRVAGSELTADLTAETFAAALLAVHHGRARSVPNGQAWLVGIARHKIADSFRHAKAEERARRELGLERIVLEPYEADAIDRLVGLDAPALGALETLEADERDAVVERIVQERDYADIAVGARQSEAAIRKRVSRGLAKLRKELRADSWTIT